MWFWCKSDKDYGWLSIGKKSGTPLFWFASSKRPVLNERPPLIKNQFSCEKRSKSSQKDLFLMAHLLWHPSPKWYIHAFRLQSSTIMYKNVYYLASIREGVLPTDLKLQIISSIFNNPCTAPKKEDKPEPWTPLSQQFSYLILEFLNMRWAQRSIMSWLGQSSFFKYIFALFFHS